MTRSLILPPLRRTASDAERFARVVHDGQTDKAGRPYVEHLERVAKRTEELAHQTGLRRYARDIAIQIAWLHDVLERDQRPHGLVTINDLRREEFEGEVCAGASMLSGEMWRDMAGPPMSYREKVEAIIVLGRGTRNIVKLADLEDNLDPERLALLPGDVRAGIKRDRVPALAMLRAAVERERA